MTSREGGETQGVRRYSKEMQTDDKGKEHRLNARVPYIRLYTF